MIFSYSEMKLALSEGHISVFSTAHSQHVVFLPRKQKVLQSNANSIINHQFRFCIRFLTL